MHQYIWLINYYNLIYIICFTVCKFCKKLYDMCEVTEYLIHKGERYNGM